MEFYGNLFKYLSALKLPRSRAELNTIIDGRVGSGGGGGGTPGSATGVTALLSADSMTLPADPLGNVISFVDAVTTMTILLGPNNDTVNWTITRVNGVGISSVLAGPTLSLTAMSVDLSYVDLTATKSGYSPLTKRFTVTKARQGATGAPGATGGSVIPDTTPPPTPAGLSATAGISQFMVQWTAANYTVGHGPKATYIYAIPQDPSNTNLPVFNANALIMTVADPLNIVSIPSNPNTRWFIWIKFETSDGYLSVVPAGGVNGIQVTTGQDVSTLITALTGSITQSQLYSALSTRIDLIDGSSSLTGSVNSRIATETSARVTAVSTEATNRDGAIATSATSLTADYVARDATTLASANSYSSAYVNSYTYSSAGVNSAIASQITTLSTLIGNAGGNLVSNSGFEVDANGDGIASGWAGYTGTEAVTLSLTSGRLGGAGQRVSWLGTSTTVKGVRSSSALVEGGITGGVRGGWIANKAYVVSWYAKAAAGASGFPMQLSWNIAPATTTTLLNPNLSSTVWQRYAFQITTGATVSTNGEFFLSILLGSAAVGFIDFDDVQIQEGILLTGYSQGDQPSLTSAIQQETTARTAGDATNAAAILTVQSTVAGFAPNQSWEFNGSTNSWIGYPSLFGSVTNTSTSLIAVANSSGDLIIERTLATTEQFSGIQVDKVRARLRRTAGAGWTGNLYYGVLGGHGDSPSYYKNIPEPLWDPQGWAVAEWDMTNLSLGGADWTSNSINLLRLDITRNPASPASTTYEIDWIAVGSRSPGVTAASVQQEATTRATQTGSLFAQYTVKIDVNGYVSGFGLASTSNGAAPTSSFIIRADSFSVASPTGAGIAPVVPFMVQTTPTTINGVAVPVGVYMDAGYILNGTITNLKVANAAIDHAKISSVDAATITVGQVTAAQIDTRNLTIKDGSGTVIFSSGNPLALANIVGGAAAVANNLQQWTDVSGRPFLFRVASSGFSDVGHTLAPGLYNGETLTTLAGYTRSYGMARIRRSDGVVTFSQLYDVFANGTDATNPSGYNRGAVTLATDLNATGTDSIVVVWTYDEPAYNRLTGGLDKAMYRCGASRGIFGSPQFQSRSAYILIGIGACGEGNGFESYNGSVNSDTNAWCDVSFQLKNGSLIVTGSRATPRTLADYSYTGTLNATTDVSLVARGNCVLNGNTGTKIGGTGSWDSDIYSKDGYVGGAFASAIAGQNNMYVMFGLNSDPTTDSSYTSLDYAWYLSSDTNIYIYENGVGAGGSLGTYVAGDVFTVVYDGSNVRYFQNGVLKRSIAAGYNLTLFWDSSFNSPGVSLSNIRFAPHGNPSAIQPSNPITPGNVSTYIASAAIQDAQIGNLNAGKINAGSLNAAFITAGTITTDRIVVGAVTAASQAYGAGALTYIGTGVYTVDTGQVTLFPFTATGSYVSVTGQIYVNIQFRNMTGVDFVEISCQYYTDGLYRIGSGVRIRATGAGTTTNPLVAVTVPLVWREIMSAGSHTLSLDTQIVFYNAYGNTITTPDNTSFYYIKTYFIAQENKV